MAILTQRAFTNYNDTIAATLDSINADRLLPKNTPIILKPNLTNDSPPPVTTPVSLVEAIYKYCRRHTRAPIYIGEGCGSGKTIDTFKRNGYTALAKRYQIELLDFNQLPFTRLCRTDTFQLAEFHVPEITLNAFIISIPVLKDHSFTTTTISMKNMFGLAPQQIYGGSWNKSGLHSPSTHHSVVDVCLYRKPDLCVVDAVTALTGMHLSGVPKRLDTIIAGTDPVAVDAAGSRLLGHDPADIEYLRLADGRIGKIAPAT